MFIISSFFSCIYSFRLLIRLFILKNNSYKVYFNKQHDNKYMLIVLFILSLSSIFFGYLFNDILIGFENFVWNNSTLIFTRNINNFEFEFLSFNYKIMTLVFVFISFLLVLFINFNNKINYIIKFNNIINFNSIGFFFENGGFFNYIYNNIIVLLFLNLSYWVYKFIDKGVLSFLDLQDLCF